VSVGKLVIKDICASPYICLTMMNSSRLELIRLERTITRDKNLRYSLFSYLLAAMILLNLFFFQSPIIGISASLIYVFINAFFLGHVLFRSQEPFFRLILGSLVFLMLLGFVGWLVLTVYDLDVMALFVVLLIAATVSSLMNRRMKYIDG